MFALVTRLAAGTIFPADATLVAVSSPGDAAGCTVAWSWLLAVVPFCCPGCFPADLVAPLLLLALCAGALLWGRGAVVAAVVAGGGPALTTPAKKATETVSTAV